MLILDDPASVSRIADPELRRRVEQRFIDICAGEAYEEDYDADLHGYFIVVEPGDSVELLQQESGCPILHNDIAFGDLAFIPSYEVLEEHAGCYEMVFVPGDGDFGIVIFIPKTAGINARAIALGMHS